jgi:sorbitol-specific phosphotransferase system component IIA
MTYVFKYRRSFLWKSFKVIGHTYDANQDKMVIFFPDGGVQEISSWKTCEVKLGTDWVVSQKKQLEAQAGQTIPLAVGS